jgi:hypothetical protein
MYEEDYPFKAYSIAVYQPRNFPELPVAPVFNILDEEGKWIRPRNFMQPGHVPEENYELLKDYRDALLRLYDGRRAAINRWLKDGPKRAVLCCWCPYDRAAQRQLQDFGSFVCHSGVVGLYLKMLGVRVQYDKDREKMWRP